MSTTAEEVRAEDQQERDARLQDALEEHGDEISGEDSFSFEEMDPHEESETIQRIQGKLEEDTWQAVVLDDVVVECRPLSESVKKDMTAMAGVFAQVSQAESVEELDQETIEELTQWDQTLEGMLAQVTVEPAMDEEWWAEGDYPETLKIELFSACYEHHQEVMASIGKFQQDKDGPGVGRGPDGLGPDT